eukprot:CAMPEP_0178883278 /NCGR_PEP_ID=MMETSP0747-20121128/13993_1 /TAXON_ID=913974 /ORGANISM="Nitzschia punctata, Strain CCMP561" /LENGTH=115 /DNA_ID=CAMNT_0020551391 /DNA_START=64 /DNA_END=411 /DNA_ORIENTATION=+
MKTNKSRSSSCPHNRNRSQDETQHDTGNSSRRPTGAERRTSTSRQTGFWLPHLGNDHQHSIPTLSGDLVDGRDLTQAERMERLHSILDLALHIARTSDIGGVSTISDTERPEEKQ